MSPGGSCQVCSPLGTPSYPGRCPGEEFSNEFEGDNQLELFLRRHEMHEIKCLLEMKRRCSELGM